MDRESALSCFLDASAPDVVEGAVRPVSLLETIERTARALVPHVGGTVESVAVSTAGYEGMLEDLARRVLEVCESVLSVELLAAGGAEQGVEGLFALGSSPDVWRARLDVYPGLGFVLGTACVQWRRSLVELLARWRDDADRVCAAWAGGTRCGALVSFFGGAGDRHNGGRSVALLGFASGFGVVYKPKDLRVVAATMRVFAALDEHGTEPMLPVRGVLCADGYGWEERVEAVATTGPEQFELFYRRLGALARVAQHLGARDLWADNLVAVGAEPHFVDLECVCFAPLDADEGDPTLSLTVRAEQTVVRTAIVLAASLPGHGVVAPDIGCLSHAGDPVDGGGGGIPLGSYRPWVPGRTAEPWDYAEAVVEGYREGDRLLRARRDALLDPDGVLGAYRGAPVRYIARSTWEYQRLLRASLSARALADDDVRRELDEAVRAAGGPNGGGERSRAVAEAEVAALRDLDVPLFTTIVDGTELRTAAGEVLAGPPMRSAWDGLLERTRALAAFPFDDEVAVLRAAVDAARGARPVAWQDASGATSAVRRAGRDDVLEALEEVAIVLLDAREAPLGDGRGWLSLTWSPTQGTFHVDAAGADLSGGALGPALVLAEYATLTGNPRAARAVREVLTDLDGSAGTSLATRLEARFECWGWPVGGLAGPGALVHVALRAAPVLGDARLEAILRHQVDRAATLLDGLPVGTGLCAGVAGLHAQLLGALAGAATLDGEIAPGLEAVVRELLRRTAALLEHALGDPTSEPEPPEVTTRLAELAPSGRDGVAYALARTVAVAPGLLVDPKRVKAMLSGFRADEDHFGGRLVALAIEGAAAVPRLLVGTEGLAASTSGSRAPTATLITDAALSQRVLQLRDDDRHAAVSERAVAALLERRRAAGRWFPDRLVDDRLHLSALDGLPALGRVLLRHLDPSLGVLSVAS